MSFLHHISLWFLFRSYLHIFYFLLWILLDCIHFIFHPPPDNIVVTVNFPCIVSHERTFEPPNIFYLFILTHEAREKLFYSFFFLFIQKVTKRLVHVDREGHFIGILEMRVVKTYSDCVVSLFGKSGFKGLERLMMVSQLFIIYDPWV